MIQHLADLPATEFLSVEEQRHLITAAQDVPVTVLTEEDGTERLVYGKTPASEAALERLTTAFIAAIRKAARTSKVLDEDEAFATCVAEFIAAVRRYDLTSDVPFSATISTVLRWTLADADKTSDLIVVKENVAARYWRLMHKHDHDVAAAYTECRDTSNGFDPATFLAVHRALGVESMDAMLAVDADAFAASSIHRDLGPEATVVQEDLIRWLFTQVDERQETILRLRYGFGDAATENLLVAFGIHLGTVLTDVAVSEVSGIGRATVQREKAKGLSLMRLALTALINEGEAA